MRNEHEQKRSDGRFTEILQPTLFGFVAVVIVFIVDLLSTRIFNPAFLDRFRIFHVWLSVLFIIGGIVLGIRSVQDRLRRRYLIPILYISAAVIFVWLIGKSCPDCPFRGGSDAEIIMKTLEAEGTAVVRKDLNLVQKIFAVDAIIVDAASCDTLSRDDRYSTLFENTDFDWARQYEFQRIPGELSNTTVTYTTGSRGRFWDKATGSWHEYENPPGSNEWTLQKNDCGCWVIVKFRFNVP